MLEEKDKIATACWRVADNALALSFPSSRGGNYLVGVFEKKGRMCVMHTCPASSRGYDCWHIYKAAEYYGFWKGRDIEPKDVFGVNRKIELNPKWEQLEVPQKQTEIPEIPDEIFDLLFKKEVSR